MTNYRYHFYPFLGILLNFLTTWGDPYYLGMTGLELFDSRGDKVQISDEMVTADPVDLHVLPGYEDDVRTLDK